jgi:hypothetical protein
VTGPQAAWILLTEEASRPSVSPQTILLIIAASVAIIFMMRSSRKSRQAASIRAALAERDRGASEGPVRGPGTPRGQDDPEVARLYIELSEFARELEGRIDTKMAYLRRLTADADRVLGDLTRAIAAADAVRRGEAPPPLTPLTPPTQTELPVDAGSEEAPPPPPTIDITVGAPGTGSSPISGGGDRGEEEGLRARILRLAAEGRPKEAIADEVGMPKGEVDLVLSLERAKGGVRKG